jgi:hypothetical protein
MQQVVQERRAAAYLDCHPAEQDAKLVILFEAAATPRAGKRGRHRGQ